MSLQLTAINDLPLTFGDRRAASGDLALEREAYVNVAVGMLRGEEPCFAHGIRVNTVDQVLWMLASEQ